MIADEQLADVKRRFEAALGREVQVRVIPASIAVSVDDPVFTLESRYAIYDIEDEIRASIPGISLDVRVECARPEDE